MLNLINSLLPVFCLCIGFFLGYKLQDKKKVELPEVIKHPKKYVETKKKEKQEEKEVREKIEYFNDVLYNIEHYDGSGKGQKSVKRGAN